MSRDWRLYAKDIQEKSRYIQRALSRLNEISEYLKDESIQLSVERAFEIIGEAAKHLPAEEKEKCGHIPWKAIIGMRDQLAHGYHKLDEEIIWHTGRNELDALLAAVDKMLQ